MIHYNVLGWLVAAKNSFQTAMLAPHEPGPSTSFRKLL